jgi:hypothetical protein
VINTDGTRLRQVTDTAENEIPEGWSHDGTRVVVDYATLHGSTLAKGDIAVVTVATAPQ